MKIVETNTQHPDFKQLTTLLDAHFWELYGDVQAQFDDYNAAKAADVDTALLIYEEARPVACGCFIHFDAERAEVKRVFVDPIMRGRGLANIIMQRLEDWAKSLGYKELILETGYQQASAIRLYEKLGYQRIPNYGFYTAVKESVCFGKLL